MVRRLRLHLLWAKKIRKVNDVITNLGTCSSWKLVASHWRPKRWRWLWLETSCPRHHPPLQWRCDLESRNRVNLYFKRLTMLQFYSLSTRSLSRRELSMTLISPETGSNRTLFSITSSPKRRVYSTRPSSPSSKSSAKIWNHFIRSIIVWLSIKQWITSNNSTAEHNCKPANWCEELSPKRD